MSGFKNSTKMRSGFHFGSSAGFTTSTGKVQNISYSRKTPHRREKLAEGGTVVRGSSVAGKSALGALRDAVMPKRSSTRVDTINKTVDRMSKATGGRVDSSLHSFKEDSQLNVEHGPTGGLRPGFTRGGYAAKYAKGGKIPSAKVATRQAKTAVAKHVATPAPKGHKGLKSC